MHDLFQIYLNTICSRIEVEHFAKRVKPVKFCLVSDYPVFGVTEVFFLAQATIGELRAALEELRQSKERLVQALNPAELFVSSISSRS